MFSKTLSFSFEYWHWLVLVSKIPKGCERGKLIQRARERVTVRKEKRTREREGEREREIKRERERKRMETDPLSYVANILQSVSPDHQGSIKCV